jgi:hypothetical protein
MAMIEIAMRNADDCSFILPQGSCQFQHSGRPYYERRENRKVKKLKKDTGLEFYMEAMSIDCSAYDECFSNTDITVKCLDIVRENCR